MRLFSPVITGSSAISGSLSVTGSLFVSSADNSIFLIRNNNNTAVLTVSQSGVVIFATQSSELTGQAPNGAVYFTSSSFFVGLE